MILVSILIGCSIKHENDDKTSNKIYYILDTGIDKKDRFYINTFINGNGKKNMDTVYVDRADMVFEMAKTILYRYYGKEKINNEMPLHILLYNNIWYIDGSMPPAPPGTITFGGTAHIEIRKDGKIMNVTHGK